MSTGTGLPIAGTEDLVITEFNNLVANLKYNPFVNLLANGNMERTTHGDLQCDYWIEAAAANVRSGTQKKFGDYALKITATGTGDYVYQDIINFAEFKGLSIAAACWVYAPDTNVIIKISDGVGDTSSSANISMSTWELLTVAHTVDASATRIRLELKPMDNTGDFYFDGAVLVAGTQAPSTAVPFSFGDLPHHFGVYASEPTWTPEVGDEYYNTTDKQKFRYDGTNWQMTV